MHAVLVSTTRQYGFMAAAIHVIYLTTCVVVGSWLTIRTIGNRLVIG